MKSLVFVLFFILLFLSYLFEVDKVLKKNLTFFLSFKSFYLEKYIEASDKIKKYFINVDKIKQLENEILVLREYKILYENANDQLNIIKDFLINVKIPQNNPKIELVKILSYSDFNDLTNVWLDKEPDGDKIFGLVSDNFAAGIAVNKNGKLAGLLNGNEFCTYSVFIGNEKYPGILTYGDNLENIFVNYIPMSSNIKEGDEVITSGTDNIFFEGLRVGIVTKVRVQAGMKLATVKPYLDVLKKRYFYVYSQDNNSKQLSINKNFEE